MTSITYDEIGQALAITLRDSKAAETIELASDVLLDVDAEGYPLAIEFVSLQSLAPFFAAHGGEYVLPERIPLPSSKQRQRA